MDLGLDLDAEHDEPSDVGKLHSKTTLHYEQTPTCLDDPTNQLGNANLWSRNNFAIVYESRPGILDEESKDTSPLADQDSAQALIDFFTDENGVRLDAVAMSNPADDLRMLVDDHPLTLQRSGTNESALSTWTVSHVFDITMELDKLVELIRLHPSLQRADITSAEGYKQKRNGILHRFLALELRRGSKPAVWLRLDRRVHPETSRISFLLASGESPAYDTAIFSANKADLIKQAVLESRQRFETVTTLGDLGHFLRVICEELVMYRIWPANCWFFVSLLQQYLQGDETGCFVDGSVKWGDTAREIRARVKERLRLIYHMPEPFGIRDILLSVSHTLTPARQALVTKALTGGQWIISQDLRNISASTRSGFQAANALDQIAGDLLDSGLLFHEMRIREQTVEITRELCRRDPRRYQHNLADYVHGLGALLHELGRPRAALKSLNEAVSLWRLLHIRGRNHFGLIATLRRYSHVARTATRTAVISIAVFSQKSHTSAMAFRATTKSLPLHHQIGFQLADSLATLAIVLHDTRKVEDACSADAEEVQILRDLYAFDPEGYREDLSVGLHSSSLSLAAAGRGAAALALAQEAVTLRRQLFESDPDAHRAALAKYLDTLGTYLHEAGRLSDGSAADQEAVLLQREHFKSRPNLQWRRTNLVQYLNKLGRAFHEAGRFSDACAARQEVVTLYQELFRADPDPHRADLARYFSNLGASLDKLGRFNEACAAYEEAAILQQEPFQNSPDQHRAKLTQYLSQLGWAYHKAGRFDDACAAGQEVINLQRRLFQEDPDLHRGELAQCLNAYGISLGEIGRLSEAQANHQEAVTFQRELFQNNPDRSRSKLAKYLHNLASSLYDVGRFKDACVAEQEAVTLQRQLFLMDSDLHRLKLSRNLNNLAFYLCEVRRFRDAFTVSQDAVTLHRELFEADPDLHNASLAMYLNTLGASLHGARHFDEACAAYEEAVSLQEELFEANPKQNEDSLAAYLRDFGVSLLRAKRLSYACAVIQQAVEHHRRLFDQNQTLSRKNLYDSLRLYAFLLKANRCYNDATKIGIESLCLKSYNEEEVYASIGNLFEMGNVA